MAAKIPPTLKGYYLQWKTKLRKVPGTKSESSQVKLKFSISDAGQNVLNQIILCKRPQQLASIPVELVPYL